MVIAIFCELREIGGIHIAQYKSFEIPYETEGVPAEDQFMSWNEMIKAPYDKKSVDAYTRTRIILMNGIENASVLMSHCMERMTEDPEIKRQMALIRRSDSQHQQTINWLNPADQTVIETTLGYEQVAVDLTANLANNESNPYVKQTLDFALLEDFDHLYRYSCLYDYLEEGDPDNVVQGKTEIKPGRPTVIEHRHPNESMRKHYDKDTDDIKTKMNYLTIVAGEQQTELFYKSHGFMYADDLARKIYAEIAEIEEQHVTQYGLLGDPRETMLEKLTMMQLCEAYLYHSCAQSENNPRIKEVWEKFMQMEMTHFQACAKLLEKYEGRDIRDVVKADVIEPLVIFEPNKEYVNDVIEKQLDLSPHNMEFKRIRDLPDDWSSFSYQSKVNKGGVPSEDVVGKANSELARKDQAEKIKQVKQEMAQRIQNSLSGTKGF